MSNPNEPTILVIGDVLRDIYYVGGSRRTSAEAPIPIVEVEEVLEFPGGAENVAENVHALGATTILLAREPFPIKSRVILDGVQVCRFDQQDRCEPVDVEMLEGMLGNVDLDAIIVSDYAKGAINTQLVEALHTYIEDSNTPIFVNTKRNPWEWADLATCTFITNRKEYSDYSDAYRRASQVVITQGSDGVVRHIQKAIWCPMCDAHRDEGDIRSNCADPIFEVISSDTVPAFAKPSEIVSVNGAGDTFLAAYTYATLTKLYDPLLYASSAAANVVRKPYTSTTTHHETLVTLIENSKLPA
jgi:bifunctional ADP-heptose synthase (sugar kinase/adenylyltransferase)